MPAAPTPPAAPLPRRHWLLLAAGTLAWPAAARAGRHTEQRALFGSPAALSLPADEPTAAQAVWRGLATLNTRWNAWKPGDLSRLNQAFAQGRPAPVSPALQWTLQQAARLEQATEGCFNPAIGGLVGAWGFHADVLAPGRRPAAAALAPWRRARPSLAQLHFRDGLAWSSNPRVQLDLGAYGKGVAIDWALDELQRRGVADGLLDLGGNLAAFGTPAGRPWRVGVRDPLGPGLLATLETRGREAVVTSGSYERSRVLDGRPCCHILDPRSGAPADLDDDRGLVSVTVLHPSAALADAAATALLVAGPRGWARLAQRLQLQHVLVVDAQGRAQASPALAGRLLPPAAGPA